MLLTILGLRLRGVAVKQIEKRILISTDESSQIFRRAIQMRLYDPQTSTVTELGKQMVERFRTRYNKPRRMQPIGSGVFGSYPTQCEGKFFKSGKTA